MVHVPFLISYNVNDIFDNSHLSNGAAHGKIGVYKAHIFFSKNNILDIESDCIRPRECPLFR